MRVRVEKIMSHIFLLRLSKDGQPLIPWHGLCYMSVRAISYLSYICLKIVVQSPETLF